GLHQRRQFAVRHRLQGAHLDKQLAGDRAGEKSVAAGEDLPHALVLGDDRQHHVRCAGHRARTVDDAQPALAERIAGLAVAVPAHDLAAALVQTLGNRRAHPSETDQTDFHPPAPSPRCAGAPARSQDDRQWVQPGGAADSPVQAPGLRVTHGACVARRTPSSAPREQDIRRSRRNRTWIFSICIVASPCLAHRRPAGTAAPIRSRFSSGWCTIAARSECREPSMVQVLEPETAVESIEATINYVANNGEKLFTYTGGPGSLDVRTGGSLDPHQVVIRNARRFADGFSLEREGFHFVRHDTKVADFFDETEIRRVYYPEMEALVKAESGAKRVVVFDHTLRTADDELRESKRIREVVRRAHNDYTEWSGPQRVRDLVPDEADELLKRRFAILQVWRPIRHPVETF